MYPFLREEQKYVSYHTKVVHHFTNSSQKINAERQLLTLPVFEANR